MLADLILTLAVILPTVALSVWWVLRPNASRTTSAIPELPMILFNNGVVEDASSAALEQLPIVIGSHTWLDLREIFLPLYPHFPLRVLSQGNPETTLIALEGSDHHHDTVQINWLSNGASITFQKREAAPSDHAILQELDFLRQVNSELPHPAWKTDQTGAVTWHNKAYKTLAERMLKDIVNPNIPLFDLPAFSTESKVSRIKIEISPDHPSEWFSVNRSLHAAGIINHATSLTDLIKAEEAQRDFVQTLAKTFAHLSIGLAIFNRDRQLAMFNPALTDLTGLSASFLSPRPTVGSFFDAMRENRRMPEPKNYKTWRQRMADLVSAAEVGHFEETWTLEGGQTYSVKGRPHPDGAIAFLFEDISAEISLTRNFRAELELGQSLVDTFDDALAVFSQSGSLTFSNKAYDHLWGFQSETSFADVTIVDAIRMWKEKSSPNPLWQELHDSVLSLEERDEWDMPVRIRGQLPMNCKVVPITSGATVIRFSRQDASTLRELPLTANNRT